MTSIQPILDKAVKGQRLTPADGLALLQSADLAALGEAAHAVTQRLHPERERTYNIDRNINYTNVCAAVCDFCAFYRPLKHSEAYVLEKSVLFEKIHETIDLGGDQILLQGGMHPTLPIEWYEDYLSDIKARFPQINVHGFSPPELHHFTKVSKLPLRTVLQRLKAAGLGSLPGGGGEILVDRVREQITRGKALTEDWLNVNRAWHELGGVSSATMMFGHVETLQDRIEHLDRLRMLQDETGGFTAFICWTFQPPDEPPWFGNRRDGVDMSKIPPAGAFEYLKTQAVARLYLDNIRNIQSSWVTQGEKIGQLALFFGANDMGSLMIEENVVAEAGTVHHLSLEQIRRCIADAGYIPRQRNVHYELLERTPRGDIPRPAARACGPAEQLVPLEELRLSASVN
ncbi:MAG: dehypoxanthine futalosine cyclase [Planctomyces sp.]|nr:dehypoxanthine futalosine cyclase [Planctomyces sp.]